MNKLKLRFIWVGRVHTKCKFSNPLAFPLWFTFEKAAIVEYQYAAKVLEGKDKLLETMKEIDKVELMEKVKV